MEIKNNYKIICELLLHDISEFLVLLPNFLQYIFILDLPISPVLLIKICFYIGSY